MTKNRASALEERCIVIYCSGVCGWVWFKGHNFQMRQEIERVTQIPLDKQLIHVDEVLIPANEDCVAALDIAKSKYQIDSLVPIEVRFDSSVAPPCGWIYKIRILRLLGEECHERIMGINKKVMMLSKREHNRERVLAFKPELVALKNYADYLNRQLENVLLPNFREYAGPHPASPLREKNIACACLVNCIAGVNEVFEQIDQRTEEAQM